MSKSKSYTLIAIVMLIVIILIGFSSTVLTQSDTTDNLDVLDIYPHPSGEYNVGRVIHHMVDETRYETFTDDNDTYRELMIYIWYPAQAVPDSPTAPWADEPTSRGLVSILGGDVNVVQQIQVNAIENAPVATAQPTYPVLLMSHGNGAHPIFYTTFAEELASHGFIVVGITHTYNALVTVFPDGRSIAMAPEGDLLAIDTNENSDWATYVQAQWEKGNRLVSIFANDASFVLDKISELNISDPLLGGYFDLSRVGMFGHSFGGAITAEALTTDSRIQVGAIVDGDVFNTYDQGIPRPVLFLANPNNNFTELRTVSDMMRMPNITEQQAELMLVSENSNYTAYIHTPTIYGFYIPGTGHENFSDVGLLQPVLPLDWADLGPIDSRYVLRITNDYLLAFFNKYLNAYDNGLLDDPEPYPNLSEFEVDNSLGQADGEIVLIPFSDQINGINGLYPAGWQDMGGGVYERTQSSDDVASYVVQKIPMARDELLELLAVQVGITTTLHSDEQIITDTLIWDIYHSEIGTDASIVKVDFGLCEQGEILYLVLMMSTPDERGNLMESLFMPALTAISIAEI